MYVCEGREGRCGCVRGEWGGVCVRGVWSCICVLGESDHVYVC
jgi:hypothetical protein